MNDWLDGCWRCGDEATVDDRGRQLCHPCRVIVSGTETYGVPIRAMGRVFWESRAMESCWHCMTQGVVDPKDDLGLCPRCKEELVDA